MNTVSSELQTELDVDLENLSLDDNVANATQFVQQAQEKVQLDLDDAAFLDFEEEEEKKPSELAARPTDEVEVVQPKFWQRKPFVISSTLLLLVLLGGAVYYFYFMDVPPPVATVEPVVVVVPSNQSVSGKEEYHVALAPFLIEQRDENEVRFLQARFRLIAQDEAAATDAKQNILSLRDAMYYYLRNKTHQFLINPDNIEGIKQDLLDVANSYLNKGKLTLILYEDYLLK